MTANDLLQSGRFGTFKIYDSFLLRVNADVLRQAFDGMFVTRCEYNWSQRCFEYIAYHPDFDIHDPACEPPDYYLEITEKHSNHCNMIRHEFYHEWLKS